jgi:hypothetical protein
MISKFLNRKRALDRKWLWPGWQMGRKCGRAAFATPRKGCALGRARWLRPRRGYRAVAAARARSTRSKAARRWHGTGNGERLADGGEEGGALARAGRSSGAEGRRTWGGLTTGEKGGGAAAALQGTAWRDGNFGSDRWRRRLGRGPTMVRARVLLEEEHGWDGGSGLGSGDVSGARGEDGARLRRYGSGAWSDTGGGLRSCARRRK